MEPKRSWFDGTINLPTILAVILAAVSASAVGVGLYNGIEHRVTILEQRADAAKENQSAVQASLDKINDKLDRLNDRLINNSAGNRADMQRWSK